MFGYFPTISGMIYFIQGISALSSVVLIICVFILIIITRAYFRSANSKSKIEVGKVSTIYIYPIKSCQAISVLSAACTYQGLQNETGTIKDRALMFINENGTFLDARVHHQLLTIMATMQNDGRLLELKASGAEKLLVNLTEIVARGHSVVCSVWEEEITAFDCGEAAAEWIKRFLKTDKNYRLVYSANCLKNRFLQVSATSEWHQKARPKDNVAFQDFAPLMVLSENSLYDLNAKLEQPATMSQFRPNLVISAKEAYGEDLWDEICIGSTVKMKNLKPCERCVITTVNIETGKRHPLYEPLRTLKKYRPKLDSNSPCFGINCFVDVEGIVNVGDTVFAIKKN